MLAHRVFWVPGLLPLHVQAQAPNVAAAQRRQHVLIVQQAACTPVGAFVQEEQSVPACRQAPGWQLTGERIQGTCAGIAAASGTPLAMFTMSTPGLQAASSAAFTSPRVCSFWLQASTSTSASVAMACRSAQLPRASSRASAGCSPVQALRLTARSSAPKGFNLHGRQRLGMRSCVCQALGSSSSGVAGRRTAASPVQVWEWCHACMHADAADIARQPGSLSPQDDSPSTHQGLPGHQLPGDAAKAHDEHALAEQGLP